MIKGVVLIAGGTGLVGRELCSLLEVNGFIVKVLSRRKSDPENNLYHWDINSNYIDPQACTGVTHIINLAGTAVAGPRWTKKRKEDIIYSRVQSANCLFKNFKESQSIESYITASGINAYSYSTDSIAITEEAPFGNHYLADVVKKWEDAADQFKNICPVTKLRIGVVFSKNGGALATMALPIKLFVGMPLGSGNQWVPWIDSEDLCALFLHAIKFKLNGSYNAIQGNIKNKDLHKSIASLLKRPLWPMHLPSLALKIILGKQSTIVINGLFAANDKIIESGFSFTHNLESSLQKNLSKR